MKAGQIQHTLSHLNRWWRSPSWERDDPDLRAAHAAPFTYRAGCLADLTPGGLYTLRGPRRVGKSTEVKNAVSELISSGVPPRNIVHAAVEGWSAEDVRSMVLNASRAFLSNATGSRYWFLDEITSVTGDWPNVIKHLRDNDPEFSRDTVVLTGSSSGRLHEIRKALAGRRGNAKNTDRVLLPMSFTDFVSSAGVQPPKVEPIRIRDFSTPEVATSVDALMPYLSDLVPLWETYLRVGGFPQAVAMWKNTGDVEDEFFDTLWDTIHGDAINADRFTIPQTLTLLSRLSSNLCSPLNVRDLARDLDVAAATVDERLADLLEHFIAWHCYQEQGMAPKLTAQRKWYFADPLFARLAGTRGYAREPDLSKLSQQQIGISLLRNLAFERGMSPMDFDTILYYRSKTRAEIDFVSRVFGDWAIESKYVDDGWGREMQTITASPWQGIMVSRSGLDRLPGGVVIPASIFALLVGG